MIEDKIFYLIKDLGFPMVVAMILLYDKVKTNGSLLRVVEHNSTVLKDIKDFLIKKM